MDVGCEAYIADFAMVRSLNARKKLSSSRAGAYDRMSSLTDAFDR